MSTTTTTTITEPQRELLRGAYTEGMLRNYEHLATSPSERVRFKALRRLAQTVGIVPVLPQLYDLAREAESDRIALQANDLIADYLDICTDASAHPNSVPPAPQLRHTPTPKLRHTRACRGYLAAPSTKPPTHPGHLPRPTKTYQT